ncbi:MAG: hypothetical protein QF681_18450, partial [Vicinamibacterales bacterium]|nr:hypothetical protein [Vicinamibacterales bacterium]
ESEDAGRTWSATREMARTTGISDHPLLISNGAGVMLTWHTEQEGFHVLPLQTRRPPTSGQ